MDSVLGFYRRRIRAEGVTDGRSGSVTVVQRCNSDLKLNPHWRGLFADGVYVKQTDGRPVFHPLSRLCTEEVGDLMQVVRARILSHLARRGVIEAGEDLTWPRSCSPVLAGPRAAFQVLRRRPNCSTHKPPKPSQGQEESWLFLSMTKTRPQDGRRGPIVEWLHGPTGQPLGKMVEDPATGKITGFDAHGKLKGTYNPKTNTTSGTGGRPVGTGNLLSALVMNCACPSGVGGTRRSVVVKKAQLGGGNGGSR